MERELVESPFLKVTDLYLDIHHNFIINSNNATYTDIIKLIKYIKKQIKKIYNIDLVVEQQIIK